MNNLSVDEYQKKISEISEILEACEDERLLDLIYKILLKCTRTA